MIIRESIEYGDVYDYAIWAGAFDAAAGTKRDYLFSVELLTAYECRKLYELAYDLEVESKVVYHTAEHVVDAFVRTWDDCHGQGTAEWTESGFVKQLYFNYHSVENDSQLEPGMVVELKFKHTDDGREALKVKPKTKQP